MVVTLIVFIIVLLLGYFLLFRQDKQKSPDAKPVQKEYLSKRVNHAVSGQSMSIPEVIARNGQASPANFADSGFNRSDIYAEKRQFLKTGIESIFSSGTISPVDHIIPLRKEQVQPEKLKDMIKHISSLQNFRTEQARLQKMINDPSIQLSDFSKIVLSDPVLTAKILQAANSSYFGMQQKIDSISHALMILGLQNVKNTMYREGLHQLFQASSRQQAAVLGALWKHSSITAVCASHLHDLFGDMNMGTLFTLGIIHDIGKLIILELPQLKEQGKGLPDGYSTEMSIWEEDQLLGVNHEVIGGMALESWNFSELMINAVQLHHVPSYLDADKTGLSEEQLKYVVAVFIADQISRLFTGWPEGIIRTYPLRDSYHYLIDKNKLLNKLCDANFLAQIREAEAVAAAEQNQMAGTAAQPIDSVNVADVDGRTQFREKSFAGDVTTIIKRVKPVSKIGRYEIIREIGRGALDIVYLAKDFQHNRDVAIKTLRYQDADEQEIAEAKARFFSEAEIIGKLSHPNIVHVYEVGEHNGMAYIVMEFLDGTDLVPYCDKNNRLPVNDVARIIAAAARALEYAHEKGVVHRDIKPGNIRILKNGDIKVIDFGVARILEPSMTSSGRIVGSPSYMSPEQIDGQAIDSRSDLFSLGVIFYELLTGRKPFQGESFTKLLMQITTAQYIPIKDFVPDVAEVCNAVVEKALAKNKEQRYQSGREFAADLFHLLQNSSADLPLSAQNA